MSTSKLILTHSRLKYTANKLAFPLLPLGFLQQPFRMEKDNFPLAQQSRSHSSLKARTWNLSANVNSQAGYTTENFAWSRFVPMPSLWHTCFVLLSSSSSQLYTTAQACSALQSHRTRHPPQQPAYAQVTETMSRRGEKKPQTKTQKTQPQKTVKLIYSSHSKLWSSPMTPYVVTHIPPSVQCGNVQVTLT